MKPEFEELLRRQKRAMSFRDFCIALLPSIPVNLVDDLTSKAKDFVGLLTSLHAIAEYMVRTQNLLELERRSPRLLRPVRKRFFRTRSKLGHALRYLRDAQGLLRDDMKEFRRNSLHFTEAQRAIEKTQHALKNLEKRLSVMIHPRLRTAAERDMAADTRMALKRTPLPISGGSAKLQYTVTGMVERAFRKFGKHKIFSNHIDRFISKFFAAAVNLTITEENVKTMRLRIGREKRARIARRKTSEKPRVTPFNSSTR